LDAMGHGVTPVSIYNKLLNAKTWPVNDWKNRLILHFFGRMEDPKARKVEGFGGIRGLRSSFPNSPQG